MRTPPLSRLVLVLVLVIPVILLPATAGAQPYPIQIGFLWHMHQPIYYPYESPVVTDANNRFSYSVVDIHNQRFGPYTGWPRDAVVTGSGLAHLGAQVSFTGSLIENLNNLEAAGINGGMWNNWDGGYDQGMGMLTSLGNRRLELVAFGYHHPLMPLLDERDIRMQIRLHKQIYGQTWAGGSNYSHGLFPAETAFSTRMIPALVAEGLDWVIVDNIHFDRACAGYPQTDGSGIYAPNVADQMNPDPATTGGAWVQLNNLWAPSRVSAPFGYRPHYAEYVNPATGQVTRMVAVPAARYEGNEDGRGGYGAFLYDTVMDQYRAYNTDAAHPMFVVLHHDGDNYGGGSDSYYHNNFQNMVNWVSSDPDYDVTTIEDYLDRFPLAANDVIHVEDGSWAGADAGDPEFKKWLGDPSTSGWSPDRNSWAVLTAAKNRVYMADDVAPYASVQHIIDGSGTNTERAWHYLLCGEASDYWYWDGTEIWDSNVTRACNAAVQYADAAIAGQPDATPPTIFVPQREPYNPGGIEWGATPMPSDFEVWTYAYDVSGLTSVTLKWRLDLDGENPLGSVQNETYAGGAEVGAWTSVATSSADVAPPGGILVPTYRALRYGAMITGQDNVLVDYYVEAADGQGNVARTPIRHVWVGESSGGPGGDVVVVTPEPVEAGQPVTIAYNPSGRPLAAAAQVYLHYGFNGWNPVIAPDPAMTWNTAEAVWRITVAVPSNAVQLDFVFNNGGGTWDNNAGADWHYTVEGGSPGNDWVMDGQLDSGTSLVAQNGTLALYADFDGQKLYVAAPDAGQGNDHFIFVAAPVGTMRPAPWAKAGMVANWGALLCNENDNLWNGWQDTTAAVQSAVGGGTGWLEGTIDVAGEFGSVPNTVYLAFAPYASPNGGALISAAQIPASVNSDGNVDAAEYVPFVLVQQYAAGDTNCSGDVGFDDINPFVQMLLDLPAWQSQHPGCPLSTGDINGDSEVDFADINPFVTLLLR